VAVFFRCQGEGSTGLAEDGINRGTALLANCTYYRENRTFGAKFWWFYGTNFGRGLAAAFIDFSGMWCL